MLRTAAPSPDRIPVFFGECAALAEVDTYTHVPHSRRSPWFCDSPDDYYGYTEIEWHLLDLGGDPAPALEEELSQRERDDITSELLHLAAQYRRDGGDL